MLPSGTGAPDAFWLLELADDGLTGFMPPPMPDSMWVLNAVYEHEQVPTDLPYDACHRARVSEGTIAPQIVGGIDLSRMGTATGGGLGSADHPG
ncbi:hypothetical protein [Streptomyces sp. NPDC006510]|uniref:hypothetical protein n=1 Tax=Streptomyces sp. NPDC006510 TaxID=3155600 RepID=UPI0033A257B0